MSQCLQQELLRSLCVGCVLDIFGHTTWLQQCIQDRVRYTGFYASEKDLSVAIAAADATVTKGLVDVGTWAYRAEFAQKVSSIREMFGAAAQPAESKESVPLSGGDLLEEQGEEEEPVEIDPVVEPPVPKKTPKTPRNKDNSLKPQPKKTSTPKKKSTPNKDNNRKERNTPKKEGTPKKDHTPKKSKGHRDDKKTTGKRPRS